MQISRYHLTQEAQQALISRFDVWATNRPALGRVEAYLQDSEVSGNIGCYPQWIVCLLIDESR
jgi:hypothetical protein